jgi:hypothetical protein
MRTDKEEIDTMYEELHLRWEALDKSGLRGRPRLDRHPQFIGALKRIMRQVNDGTLSYRKGAKQLGISPMSLKRYADNHGLIRS